MSAGDSYCEAALEMSVWVHSGARMSLWLWWRLIRIPSRIDAPLTAIVRGMDPVLRDHLSDICVHFRGETAEVSLRMARFRSPEAGPGENPWHATDKDPGGAARWPTLVHEIPLDMTMGEQLENLERSELVGGLRNTRNQHGNNFGGLRPKRTWGPPAGRSWRLLTNAGSEEERSAWLLANQRRISSTAGKSEIASIT